MGICDYIFHSTNKNCIIETNTSNFTDLSNNASKPDCLSYTAAQANQKGFYFRINGQNCKIMNYKGTDKHVTIPSYINGKPVTVIGVRAFGAKGIESVILPDTLRVIRTEAFADNLMESITFPPNICCVADGTFLRCKFLREVHTTKTHGINISHHAFKATHYITARQFVTLGDMLLMINVSASCRDTFLEIPSGIYEIKREALYWSNYNYEEIGIPASVNHIEDRAFASCHRLKDVLLEKGQKSPYFTLGKSAFGSFSKNNYHENTFLWNLRRRCIRGDLHQKSGWITFQAIEIGRLNYQNIDIYVPHSICDAFWNMITVTFSYNIKLGRREFIMAIDSWGDYTRLFEQSASLHEKIEMAVFLYTHFQYSGAARKEFTFLAQHIYKAIGYAVADNLKTRLMLYKKMGLLSPERGFQSKKVRHLLERYDNEAAIYLKENIEKSF